MNTPDSVLASLNLSGQLPSMPQALVQLIDSCHTPDIPFQAIANIIDKDAAISAKILQLVNSAFIGPRRTITSVEQAVVYLGIDAVRNLAISISVQQVFRRGEKNGPLTLDRFWHHSYQNALLSRKIATTIDYPEPSEAYLAGLLHDIGKLLLWMAFPGSYAPLLLKGVRCVNARLAFLEEEKLHVNHCQAGAWLGEQWRLPTLLTDAIRYHHHPIEAVRQALPLVRITSLADLLSHGDPTATDGLEAAHQLLGLTAAQVATVFDGLDEQVEQIATHMGIRIPRDAGHSSDPRPDEVKEAHKDASRTLINRVRDVSQLCGLLDNLLRAEDRERIVRAVEQGILLLLDERRCLLLLTDTATGQLRAHVPTDASLTGEAERLAFVPQDHAGSLPARALEERRMLHAFSGTHESSTQDHLLDAHLRRLLGTEGLAAIPLIHHGEIEGLLLVGLERRTQRLLLAQATSVRLLADHAAAALHLDRMHAARAEQIAAERLQAATLVARNIAHEINNPLAILRNYLHILAGKNRQGQSIDAEVAIIDGELERIAHITTGLQNLARESEAMHLEPLDLHRLLEEILDLFRAALPEDKQVRLTFTPLDEQLSPMADSRSLRQIMQNLLGNALDAVSPGGMITVHTKRAHKNVLITVTDNGPGVAPAIRDSLFQAGVSTKNGRHSGLGLAIADQLARRMGGSLSCASVPGTTVFTLQLSA